MDFKSIDHYKLNARAEASVFAPREGIAECHLMIHGCDPALPFARQLRNLDEAYALSLSELPQGMKPVFKRYFLSDVTNQGKFIADDPDCAVSIVGQPPLNGTKCAMWAYLQQDMSTAAIAPGLRSASHSAYTHYWRSGMAMPHMSSYAATVGILENYSDELARAGCSLLDNCLRTWFFVRDVDVTYGGVVKGRNELFALKGLTTDTHFIASTGICGKHIDPHVAVQMDAYALKGHKPGQVRYLQAPTHLNPTTDYGVAFERATSIDYGDRRHVLVSGTASIDNTGKIAHENDVAAQTLRMMQNVEALLKSADCGWESVAHAIVYLRDMADYTVAKGIFDRERPGLPAVFVLAPVCRPGWLVEMECMAIKAVENPEYAPL